MQINLEPCHKFTSNKLIDQALYIKGECEELIKELLSGDYAAADLELMDIVQACVTYIGCKGYSQEYVDRLTRMVIAKNKAKNKGYYAKEGVCIE